MRIKQTQFAKASQQFQELKAFVKGGVSGDVVKIKGFESSKAAFKRLAISVMKTMFASIGGGDYYFCAGGPAVSGKLIGNNRTTRL